MPQPLRSSSRLRAKSVVQTSNHLSNPLASAAGAKASQRSQRTSKATRRRGPKSKPGLQSGSKNTTSSLNPKRTDPAGANTGRRNQAKPVQARGRRRGRPPAKRSRLQYAHPTLKSDNANDNLHPLPSDEEANRDHRSVSPSGLSATSSNTSSSSTGSKTAQKIRQQVIASIYRSEGHEPPHCYRMASTRDQSPSSSRTTKSRKQSKKTLSFLRGQTVKVGPEEPLFNKGLDHRNVDAEPFADPNGAEVKILILSPRDDVVVTVEDEDKWRADLGKCKLSCEALFQRTIMMDALDRHSLGGALEYSCEADAKWASPRPPSGNPLGPDKPDVICSYPCSDLLVGFPLRRLIEPVERKFLGSLEGHMCPQHDNTSKHACAFPFLAFEVKGAAGDIADSRATRQALNTASLALFNIWKFVKGEDEEELFFTRLKIFTVTANALRFVVRAHYPRFTARRQFNREDPISYNFDIVCELSGDTYTRSRVLSVVKNILDYAQNELLSTLQKVVPKALKREELKLSETRRNNQQQKVAGSSILDEDEGRHSERTSSISPSRKRNQEGPGSPKKRHQRGEPSAINQSFESHASVNSNLRNMDI